MRLIYFVSVACLAAGTMAASDSKFTVKDLTPKQKKQYNKLTTKIQKKNFLKNLAKKASKDTEGGESENQGDKQEILPYDPDQVFEIIQGKVEDMIQEKMEAIDGRFYRLNDLIDLVKKYFDKGKLLDYVRNEQMDKEWRHAYCVGDFAYCQVALPT